MMCDDDALLFVICSALQLTARSAMLRVKEEDITDVEDRNIIARVTHEGLFNPNGTECKINTWDVLEDNKSIMGNKMLMLLDDYIGEIPEDVMKHYVESLALNPRDQGKDVDDRNVYYTWQKLLA